MALVDTTPARHFGWFALFMAAGAVAGWADYAMRGGMWGLIFALGLSLNAATWLARWRRALREQRNA